jgi:CBS domain containing-hemolysin-like protein
MNIAGSVMASEITIRLFGSAVLGITTGILTLVVLIFGEVVPKQVAIAHNVFWTTHVARFIWVLSIVLKPVVWFMSSISRLVTRVSHGDAQSGVTRESILYLAKHAETMGILEAFKFRMVRNVLRFTEVTVNAVMTHRTRIFSLDKDLTLDEAFAKITEAGFSRVPVYDDHPEHIVGIVLLKDLVRRVAAGGNEDALKTVMVEPIFVPENRKIHEMLSQFRRFGLNIAIVLDEYGGVSGLLTIEDVVEEILGEIYDEHEVQEDDKVVSIDGHTYRLVADLPIYVANDTLGVEMPQTRDVQTVGGYIAEQLGRLPVQGEQVSTPVGEFVIESMARKRIVSVRFTPHREDEDANDGRGRNSEQAE